MRSILSRSLIAAAIIFPAHTAFAADEVAVTIKPIHSLVSAVMGDFGKPTLLLDGNASPHDAKLKPSQAESLQNAKLVFWIGEALETNLQKPIETISSTANVVELLEAEGINFLPSRELTEFELGKDEDHDHDHEKHAEHKDHDDHDHDKHAEHKDHDDHDHDKHAEHKDHDDHGHDKHAEHKDHDDHGHDKHAEHKDHDDHGHDNHDHGDVDAHIWLSPKNAVKLTGLIAEKLSEVFPQEAATFAKNAEATKAKLTALDGTIKDTLATSAAKSYIVFHDSYQYYEKSFGFETAGVVHVNPTEGLSVKHLQALRDAIKSNSVKCVFSEPQFGTKLTNQIAEGSGVWIGNIDPLGSKFEAGPNQYFETLTDLTEQFKTCFDS